MVLNRRLDADIISALDGATNNLGGATTLTLAIVAKALVTLGENEVPVEEEDNMFAVMTPACLGYLMQIDAFNNADYVSVKYLDGPSVRMKRWAGFNWIFHPNLTGTGTASEKTYFFHRNSIGSAFDMDGLNTAIGYNDEQDYSYARASSFTASGILQQSGVLQFLHNASAI